MSRGKGIGGHTKPNTGASDCWLTPPWLLSLLRPFDLDPCPCLPQPWETAKRVIEGDGLAAEWPQDERVFLNPPYGPQLGKWLAKLASHGNGIAVCFARTETQAFFESVWGKADGLLFLQKRVHFHRPNGERAKGNAGGPTVLIAYGADMAVRLQTCGVPGAYVPGGRILGVKAGSILDSEAA